MIRWGARIGKVVGLALICGAASGPKGSDKEPRNSQAQELLAIHESTKALDKVSFTFTQKSYKTLRKKTTISSGRVYFQRPDHFRWDILQPAERSWIFDGSSLFLYYPDKKEATRYSASGGKARELTQIVDFVLNFATLSNEFDVKLADDATNKSTPGELAVVLTPKKVSDLKAVHVRYSRQEKLVKSLELLFRNDNRTQLEFTSPSLGTLPSQIFAIPAAAKVHTAT